MSAVPFYAINTSTRTWESPKLKGNGGHLCRRKKIVNCVLLLACRSTSAVLVPQHSISGSRRWCHHQRSCQLYSSPFCSRGKTCTLHCKQATSKRDGPLPALTATYPVTASRRHVSHLSHLSLFWTNDWNATQTWLVICISIAMLSLNSLEYTSVSLYQC